MFIKKGDKVKVICGKFKNKIGIVIKVFPDKNKIIIKNINLFVKHIKVKGKKEQLLKKINEKNGKIKIEMPIHSSNVMLIDPINNKISRINYKIINKKKVRFFKKTNFILDK